MTPTLSVIIPVLNESAALPGLLRALGQQHGCSIEILIADGGSTDDSCRVAEAMGARVVNTLRGRAQQMNAAAHVATGEYLLFLHADSIIEKQALLHEAIARIQREIAARGHDRVAGHFRLQFHRSSQGHAMAWRYAEEKTAFNRPHTTNGDQGFLLTRRFFESLSGFDEQLPFLEDQRLAGKIRSEGVWITLPGQVITSARRFEHAGFHNQYTLMALIMAIDAAELPGFFERVPDIYQARHETGRVLLTPYLRLARQRLRALGFREYRRCWLRIGRLGRRHWWQLFYFWDVMLRPLLGPNRYPFMRLYERLIEPFTNNRLCDGLAASVVWLHFHAVMTPWFWLKERRQLRT